MQSETAILDDLMSFMKIRVILTAAELDVFTFLHERPRTALDLAQSLSLDERAATRVLDSLVALGLLTKESATYSIAERALPLSAGHLQPLLPMLLHMNSMWDNWTHLTDTVRQGANPDLKPVIAARDPAVTKAFIGAMHAIGASLSRDIADSYNLKPYRRLIDIGGGSGTYAMSFLEKSPGLQAVIFDLPEVITLARDRLEKAGLLERVHFYSGDFYKDELPGGCDLALLSAIIHQNSPEENAALFKKVIRALEPGGTLLIRDHIMDESRTCPVAGTLFALNMLVNTRGGDTYTFSEVQQLLERAGFSQIALVRTGGRMDCLVEARKEA